MKIVDKLMLTRWQDEDEPTLSWRQRFLVREEYASQESYYWWESDYDSNPHWSVGRTLMWTHWGLGFDVQFDPCIHCEDKNAESSVYLSLRLGPLALWANRRYCPNRPNVFEPWRGGTGSPSGWESPPLPSGGTDGSSASA